MHTVKDVVDAFELENTLGGGAAKSVNYVCGRYLKSETDYVVTGGITYIKDSGVDLLLKYYKQRRLLKGQIKSKFGGGVNMHFAKVEKEDSGSLMRNHAKCFIIYALMCPMTSQIKYVGRTRNLVSRYKSYLSENDDRRNRSLDEWINLLLANSVKPFLVILEICKYKEWMEREKYWMEYFVGKGERLLNIKYGDRRMSHLPPKQKSKVKLPA